jgi:subtilisin-like proprotein convertase family protein
MISTDIQGCNAGMSFRNVNYPTLFNYGSLSSNLQCDYTNLMNGTSSAAPVTAGVVALMLEARPSLTWRDVKHILAITAEKIDGPNSLQDPTDYVLDPILNTLDHPRGRDVSGHDYDYKWILNGAGHLFSNWYGFGRVNAANAVVTAQNYELGSLGTFEQTLNSFGIWYYNSGTINLPVYEQDGATGAEISDTSIWIGHNYKVEYVQIELVTDHPFPGDLAIMLESPSGTESRLLTANSMLLLWNATRSSLTIPLGSSAFYEELSEGFWTLRVLDGSDARGNGSIVSWKLLVSGHRPVAERVYPYPPTGISLSAVPAADLTVTPVFTFTPATTTGVTYQASVTRMVGLTETTVRNWTSIGTSTVSRQLTGLTLSGDTTYYLKIRSVDGQGRISSTQLAEWSTPNI